MVFWSALSPLDLSGDGYSSLRTIFALGGGLKGGSSGDEKRNDRTTEHVFERSEGQEWNRAIVRLRG